MNGAQTNGPWFAGNLRTHGANPSMNGVDIGAADGSNVGVVFFKDGEHSPAETRANALLIAAAPNLLAALQSLHRVCADCELEVDAKRPSEAQYTAAMDAAEAAIAQVTGVAA